MFREDLEREYEPRADSENSLEFVLNEDGDGENRNKIKI
jgi:hypothetical protein